jgi:hypothetical protein
MPDDIAVLDAPVTDAPVEPEISPVSDDNGGLDAPSETPDGAEEPEGEQPEGEKGPEPELFDGNRLSDKAKATLDKIRAEDPMFAAKLRHALMQGEALKAVLPGGVKEANELRQTIEDLGGTEGIQELQAERAEWIELDQQYSKADPRFIDAIIKHGKDQFLQLAPEMFGRFQQLNPDGFSAYVSGVLVSDMLTNRVPLILERLADFIPQDQPNAVAALAKLNQYFARIEDLAKKPVTTAKEKPAPDAREVELNQREAKMVKEQWTANTSRNRLQAFNEELNRALIARGFKGANDPKITGEQMATIRELTAPRIDRFLAESPDFDKKTSSYFGARDEKGYLRYMSSLYKQGVPKALGAAINQAMGKPAAPKPVVNGNGAKPSQPKPADGYQFLSKMPDVNTFDTARTTTDMIRSGKAVLVGGKKVQWR